jgi:O-antigen ligase
MQAALIGLIALILTPGFFFYFDVTPKLLLLVLAAVASSAGIRPARFSAFWLLIVLSVVSLAASTALSPSPALSVIGTNWRRYGAVAQVALLLFAWLLSAHADRTLAMLRIVSAAGGVTALYGIAQYFGWDPILPAAGYHIGEGVWTIVRPPSTLGHAGYFATWLLFVIFLSLAIRGPFGKSTAALAVIALVLTGTRAAWLGLGAGAVVWFIWRGARISRRTLTLAAAALAASVVFYYSPPGLQLRSRARWFAEDPWGGARPLLWRDTLRMASASLAAGHGPETFTAVFPHYQSRELSRAYPDFAHESPHNIFLDALAAQGIPGLILLAAFCALGLRATWRIRSRHPAIAAALGAALAAGIVAQQFTVFIIPTATAFFAVIALAVGLDAPPPEPRRRSFIALAAALPLLYFAVRIGLADHSLAWAKRDLEAGDLAAAARHFDDSRLRGASSDLWYSRALVERPQAFAQAMAAGLRATTTAEDPFNAWYSLSALYAAQNDALRAETALREASRAHPTWFKPHWTLARLLALTGRLSEAEAEAALAVDLDGGKNDEVSQTLREIHARLQK